MITPDRAAAYSRLYCQRVSLAMEHRDPVWPEAYLLCVKACISAMVSAQDGPAIALASLHNPYVPITAEDNPYE